MENPLEVPRLGSIPSLPSVRLRETPEDFLVTEVPFDGRAEPDEPTGEHLHVEIQKRDLTTAAAVGLLAQVLEIPEREVGVAGQKDRRAVTRQWISLPAACEDRLATVAIHGLQILSAERRPRKLRLGALAGNRFRIRLPGLGAEHVEILRARLGQLAEQGVPNAFGPQRFGHGGENAVWGRAIVQSDANALYELAGSPVTRGESPRVVEARTALRENRFPDALRLFPKSFVIERHLAHAGRMGLERPEGLRTLPHARRDFLISAWQSALFNAVLRARIESFGTLLLGDAAMKHENGACFLVEDQGAEAPRAARMEVSPTGPLPGRKMLHPTGEAARIEADALLAEGCAWPTTSVRAAEGARRSLRMPLREAEVELEADGVPCLAFFLPKGSFATTVLAQFGIQDEVHGE